MTSRLAKSSLALDRAESAGEDFSSDLDQESTTSSRPALPELPASWLDRLIVLGTRLPIDEGVEGVLRAVVQTLHDILAANYKVGARVALDDGVRKVVCSEPPMSHDQLNSGRIFPDALHERTVGLPCGGASFHLASDDPRPSNARAPAVLLLERAAIVASAGLARAKAHEEAARVLVELRALKSYMVQAEKLSSLGQMAAGMVHELNNPLTSIVAYTDFMLLRATHFEDEDAKRLQRIAESANRMLRFTRDVVSYARPSSELPVNVALHSVIDRALAFCEHVIASVEVEVLREYDARVTSVRGLPEQLVQIFVNLITNACHAMEGPSDGTLRVRATKLTISTALVLQGTTVRVVVEDTGHGITTENLPLVFAPFFTTKGAGRGTGLGLSIVKNIVDIHQGRIQVESDVGDGARFILLLPLDPR
jgi:signal transduction histidine kinase